jgi:hypothetical protein
MNANPRHPNERPQMTNHLNHDRKANSPSTRRRAIVIALLPAVAAMMLAACGSTHTDKPSPGRRSQAEAPLIAYAKCMRSHGISDFPDPSISSLGGIGYSNAQTQAVNRTSSAYQAAEQACQSLPGASTTQRLLR